MRYAGERDREKMEKFKKKGWVSSTPSRLVWSSSPCLSVLFLFIYLTVRNDDNDYSCRADVCFLVFRLVCCRINCIIVGKEKPGDGLALAGRQIKGKIQQKKG